MESKKDKITLLKETAAWKKFSVGKSDRELEVAEQIVESSIMPNIKAQSVRALIVDVEKEIKKVKSITVDGVNITVEEIDITREGREGVRGIMYNTVGEINDRC